MRKLSKRAKAFEDRVDRSRHYSVDEAVEILEELSSSKFKESYDVSINLGVDPKKIGSGGSGGNRTSQRDREIGQSCGFCPGR